MKIITETPRLLLRELTTDDAQFAYDLNADPEVIRYTGDDAFASVDAAREFLSNYDQYRKFGMGRWAVIEKSSGEILGWCGLKFHEDTKEIDLGYRFFKKHWGKGFASEAAKACIYYGFEKLNLNTIVAHAIKKNTASYKVMEKIGMKFVRESSCANEEAVFYEIKK